MKKLYSLLATVMVATGVFAQTTITKWEFDAAASAAAPAASTGVGTPSILVATGTPALVVSPTGSSNKCWLVSGFPSQSTGSGTAGFKFAVNTSNYTNINVSIDIAGSNTASKYFQMQYTTDGTSWTNIGTPTAIGTGSTTPVVWVTMSNTLPATADNNTNFAFRVVSVFDPANNTSYSPVTSTSSYAGGGTVRVDNVTITGTSSTPLGTADVKNLKGSFLKNTSVDNEIHFGVKSDVSIFNVNGTLVKTASVSEHGSVNISELPKGMYIVTGKVNNEFVSQKIIKK